MLLKTHFHAVKVLCINALIDFFNTISIDVYKHSCP